ncbi:MFS transporter [Kitasatospora gansuensis]
MAIESGELAPPVQGTANEPYPEPVHAAEDAPERSRRVRWGYAAGSLVTGTFNTLPGLLLLPYLTDTLGVGAALAGLIVLLPKVWSAVLNPLAGRLTDRTTGRWGARRPYVLFGGLAVALFLASTFAGVADGTAGVWLTAAGFLLTATAFGFFQVPYAAIPADITHRTEDRIRLVGGRVAVIGLAALVAGAVGPAVVEAAGGGLAGHRWAGLFGAGVVVVGALAAFLGTARARSHQVLSSEPSLRRQLAVARANGPFRVLFACAVVQTLATGCFLAGAPYFARHVIGDPTATGVAVAAYVAPNLLAVGLWSKLAARLGNRAGYTIANLLFLAGCLTLLAAPALPVALALLLWGVAGAYHAGQLLCAYAMLPEYIARDTARTGRQQAGVFSGVFATGEVLGLALGSFAYGLVLQLFGYVSSDTGHAAAQSAGAELGVLLGVTVLPALATVGLLALHLRRRTDPVATPGAPRRSR